MFCSFEIKRFLLKRQKKTEEASSRQTMMVSDSEASIVWSAAADNVSSAVYGGAIADPALGRAFAAGLGPLLEAFALERFELVLQSKSQAFREALKSDGPSLERALRVAQEVYTPMITLCKRLERLGADNLTSGASQSSSKSLKTRADQAFLLGDSGWLREFHAQTYAYLGGHFFTFSFKKEEEEEEEEEEESDAFPTSLSTFELDAFCRIISSLDWFDFIEEPLSDILCQGVEKLINKRAKGVFEQENLLEDVISWLDTIALSWLQAILSKSSLRFKQWRTRLEFHVFEHMCQLRMSELFDMITEFPESTPALVDLKACLARTHAYRELVQSLRYAFACRLLHPGANTAQILDVYISTIKALRLLDPSGVLLEAICEPIKSYLRKREDTVRCIVTSLTDDSNSELFEELGRGDGLIAQTYAESDDEKSVYGEEWTPDPIEADPRKTSQSRKSNDILSMLVHIYGSKELFVNEFRLMLADKLLNSMDFDTEKEVRNLELLKLRFGENSMLNCEIMVKDIEDSKRINANICNSTSDSTVEVTIVSKQFWPTLAAGEDIPVHPDIKKRMDAISREYSVLKNPRQLVWKPNLGLVNIELEFDDGQKKDFTVPPLLATLIMHVSEHSPPGLSLADLAQKVDLDQDTVKKRMAYWVNQGVAKYSGSMYAAIEALAEDCTTNVLLDDEQGSSSAVNADAQLQAEMKVYEEFVRGMLNNYSSLPLDRIHNMLKMFVSTGEHKYDKSIEQLGAFLDKLVQHESLAQDPAGAYYVPK